MKPPKFLKKYFWDIEFEKLNLKKYPRYVISRTLEYGDLDAARWMRRHFSNRQINDTLRQSRNLSSKSAHFWSNVQGLKKSEVKCLSKAYRKRRKVAWPY